MDREKFAAALAEWCNGGSWNEHYVEAQKAIWRERADILRRHVKMVDLLGVKAENR